MDSKLMEAFGLNEKTTTNSKKKTTERTKLSADKNGEPNTGIQSSNSSDAINSPDTILSNNVNMSSEHLPSSSTNSHLSSDLPESSSTMDGLEESLQIVQKQSNTNDLLMYEPSNAFSENLPTDANLIPQCYFPLNSSTDSKEGLQTLFGSVQKQSNTIDLSIDVRRNTCSEDLPIMDTNFIPKCDFPLNLSTDSKADLQTQFGSVQKQSNTIDPSIDVRKNICSEDLPIMDTNLVPKCDFPLNLSTDLKENSQRLIVDDRNYSSTNTFDGMACSENLPKKSDIKTVPTIATECTIISSTDVQKHFDALSKVCSNSDTDSPVQNNSAEKLSGLEIEPHSTIVTEIGLEAFLKNSTSENQPHLISNKSTGTHKLPSSDMDTQSTGGFTINCSPDVQKHFDGTIGTMKNTLSENLPLCDRKTPVQVHDSPCDVRNHDLNLIGQNPLLKNSNEVLKPLPYENVPLKSNEICIPLLPSSGLAQTEEYSDLVHNCDHATSVIDLNKTVKIDWSKTGFNIDLSQGQTKNPAVHLEKLDLSTTGKFGRSTTGFNIDLANEKMKNQFGPQKDKCGSCQSGFNVDLSNKELKNQLINQIKKLENINLSQIDIDLTKTKPKNQGGNELQNVSLSETGFNTDLSNKELKDSFGRSECSFDSNCKNGQNDSCETPFIVNPNKSENVETGLSTDISNKELKSNLIKQIDERKHVETNFRDVSNQINKFETIETVFNTDFPREEIGKVVQIETRALNRDFSEPLNKFKNIETVFNSEFPDEMNKLGEIETGVLHSDFSEQINKFENVDLSETGVDYSCTNIAGDAFPYHINRVEHDRIDHGSGLFQYDLSDRNFELARKRDELDFSNDDDDFADDGDHLDLVHKYRQLQEQQDMLNKSLHSLTTHFAQVQFRLKQVINAPRTEQEHLLKNLEKFTFVGIPEVNELILAGTHNDSGEKSFLEHKLELEKVKHKEMISKLKKQLDQLENYVYEFGNNDSEDIPTNLIISKQQIIINELKSQFNLNISMNEDDQIKKEINELIISPMKNKEELIVQLKTQISDLEKFIGFLQTNGNCKCTVRKGDEDLKGKTINIMKKISTILHIFAEHHSKSFKTSVPKSMKENHYGDLRAQLEVAINHVLDVCKRPDQDVCIDSDYMSDGDESFNYNSKISIAIRKHLCPALQRLLEHGLTLNTSQTVSVVQYISCSVRQSQSKPSHIWELIQAYYELKNGPDFNCKANIKLSESFNLNLGGCTNLSLKQSLLSSINCILLVHSKYKKCNMDSYFKSFVCDGLNKKLLIQWLTLVLNCKQFERREVYTSWSYVSRNRFVDVAQSLNRLYEYHFSLGVVDSSITHLQNIKHAF